MAAGSGTRGKAKFVDPEKTAIAWDPDEGAYFTVEKKVHTATVGGIEVTVEADEFVDRLVWVDDAPGDDEDGSGHYEKYVGGDEDYLPQTKADTEDAS